MESNGKLIAELAGMTKELKASHTRHDAMIQEIKAETQEIKTETQEIRVEIQEIRVEIREIRAETREVKEMNRALGGMLKGHAEEMRELKAARKAQDILLQDHERFIQEHHKSLLDLREKLR